MNVNCRAAPEIIEPSVRMRVEEDVTAALQSVTTIGNEFVVNDTEWFEVGNKDQTKAKARVVNTAGYISKKFQTHLRDSRGWKIPIKKDLDGQAIDGFLELPLPADWAGCSLDRTAFRAFFERYWDDHPEEDIDHEFLRYYQTYHRRSVFGISTADAKYQQLFQAQPVPAGAVLRIGLEFETGNIASSFRALWKLNVLFLSRHIDAGVFITAVDKGSAAARIWPVSNRNGSFEELEQRNYKRNVLLPLWEFSFAPDRFDRTVPYLGSGGKTYTLKNTRKRKTIGGIAYEIWKTPGSNQELLRRITPPGPSTGPPVES